MSRLIWRREFVIGVTSGPSRSELASGGSHCDLFAQGNIGHRQLLRVASACFWRLGHNHLLVSSSSGWAPWLVEGNTDADPVKISLLWLSLGTFRSYLRWFGSWEGWCSNTTEDSPFCFALVGRDPYKKTKCYAVNEFKNIPYWIFIETRIVLPKVVIGAMKPANGSS